MYKLIICIAVLIGIFAIGVYIPFNWLNPIWLVNKAYERIDRQACEKYSYQKELQSHFVNSGLHWHTNDNSLVQTCAKFNVDLSN